MSSPLCNHNQSQPHLLFWITEDWYFCSHRLPLARAALAAGYRVTVVTQVHQHEELIKNYGIRVIPLAISRRSLNPLRELALLAKIYTIYRREHPDIVHQVAMKPVLYGSIAAYWAGIPNIVNALAGLGFIFSSTRLQARLLRPVTKLILRWIFKSNTHLILQNQDDWQLLNKLVSMPTQRIHLIRGVGVDLTTFCPIPPPLETPAGPIIILAARLLWDKGIGELVAAAQILRARGITARYVLVGAPDPGNPATVTATQLQAWVDAGLIEWWGQRADMAAVLQQCHIACLPSYREGLPKVLAEAAACGLPIVTTDTPGCREVVTHGKNGLLVPARDAQALANALATLINDPTLRMTYGQAGRQRAVIEFGSEPIIAATLAIYLANL